MYCKMLSPPKEQPSGIADPILDTPLQAAATSTNELERVAEALLALGDPSSSSSASTSNILHFTNRLSEREHPAAQVENSALWTNEDMEEIALLAEAAGIHTCKLDLEECLRLDTWYANFGTFMMPSAACFGVPAGCASCERLFGGAETCS